MWDSPNSAGIVIDAVRCCKLALNHGVGGQLDGPSSYLMKSPHNQRPDDQARADTEKFIAKYAGRPAAAAPPGAVKRRAAKAQSQTPPPDASAAKSAREPRRPCARQTRRTWG